jgi:NAD-dependent dihydropyrimidine dehydrogenase PreA subunit
MFWKNKNNRGKAVIYINNCTGCGNCVSRCRHKAIGFYELADGRYAKLMYPERCTGCGKCMNVCENNAIEFIKKTAI